jgi:hypothetical protein
MKVFCKLGLLIFSVAFAAATLSPRAAAQSPATVVPIIVDTAAPIVINTLKPASKTAGLGKFEGYVMNSNTAQITVRAKGNDMAVRTFALSQQAAQQMQAVTYKGGYQYGDKVTVYYDPQSLQAIRLKGKPSKAL